MPVQLPGPAPSGNRTRIPVLVFLDLGTWGHEREGWKHWTRPLTFPNVVSLDCKIGLRKYLPFAESCLLAEVEQAPGARAAPGSVAAVVLTSLSLHVAPLQVRPASAGTGDALWAPALEQPCCRDTGE